MANNQHEDKIMGLHNSASGRSYNQHGDPEPDFLILSMRE
jgi:hypothetical protein